MAFHASSLKERYDERISVLRISSFRLKNNKNRTDLSSKPFSSRVKLSPTTAIFTYHYGDFRNEPEDLLEICFDIMLYIANWGTRQLVFRLSKELVDATLIQEYCVDRCISISTTPKYLILDINIDDNDYLNTMRRKTLGCRI